ncbi:hypothetical protein [Microbacterium terricola]|uniref:Uncharacterized protein n=1 Tax=Microbacterium terricola TaxID=344163 RepID=A0ABM8E051_9MICO|nr:hypothetical protein [Microbacterium terricola]UYK40945.1 hypothetical protein OAU46_04665 [Microbacterium terricola]BDV31303.1 hypothetical protein Microterr_19630 [Microbacterium terricola]
MSVRGRIGVALSAAAVAAIGAVGVWMGLAATTVPTVDLGVTVNDTVSVATGTEDAAVEVTWRLQRDGDVLLSAAMASPGTMVPADFPAATRARIAISLACDARLEALALPDGVEVAEDGDEAACDSAAMDGLPARQLFVMTIDADVVEIRGHPVREWSTALAGQSTSRSPAINMLTGGIVDPAVSFAIVDPGRYSTLTAVLEAGPNDLLDLTVTPAGDVVEATSVTVEGDGEHEWVDSVAWTLTYAGLAQQFQLGEGLARWTDPSGQTFMQLLLLLSGAFIGVAASLAVERLFAWTSRLRVPEPGSPSPQE